MEAYWYVTWYIYFNDGICSLLITLIIMGHCDFKVRK